MSEPTEFIYVGKVCANPSCGFHKTLGLSKDTLMTSNVINYYPSTKEEIFHKTLCDPNIIPNLHPVKYEALKRYKYTILINGIECRFHLCQYCRREAGRIVRSMY